MSAQEFYFMTLPPAPEGLFSQGDTSKLKYPFDDNPGGSTATGYQSPLYLGGGSNLNTEYKMSEDGKGFYIIEKVGNEQVRPPTYMPADAFYKYMAKKQEEDYLKELALSDQGSSLDGKVPPINVNTNLFKDIFGSGNVQIIPNGTALLTFGGRINRNRNPSLTLQQQRNFQFVFDQQIQFNVVGKIGEKLQLKVNWNTQANFDFENQFKIEYTGTEDEIIQNIQAGNVSLPLKGSLITGAQNLFGVKMALKFGPVLVTAIASQQKGKQNTVTIRGGAALTPFEKKADDYDEWRHFFLSHYFRSQYEDALSNLPALRPKIRINNIQVWVTNTATAVSNLRNAVGFVDLGENDPAENGRIYNPTAANFTPGVKYPSNSANGLYDKLKNPPAGRNPRNRNDQIYRDLNTAQATYSIRPGQDFEVTDNMRMLTENSDFRVNRELGYISLNSRLNNNEVIFVAYEYTVIGDPSNTVYKVGEFSQDVPADNQNPNVLFLKMLKRSSVNPVDDQGKQYPAWDLMMKNIYNIGGYNLKPDNFRMDIFFQSTGGAGDINYLPTGAVRNVPLIQVTNMDRLRNNSELGADNLFDFLDKKTVDAEKGFIIFPVLEPFGSHLAEKLENNPRDVNQYAFKSLYSKTRADAIAFSPQVNRYYLKGSYQTSVGTDISLNAVNLAPNSVRVTAGGAQLTEGVDYTVNYQAGKVSIINPGVASSGQDIKITFETLTLFAMQPKTLVGSRFDIKLTKNLNLGATIMHLNERPLTQKIILGDEPVSNTIWGADIAWQAESKLLTDLIDKLPLLSTREKSSLNFSGEVAQLLPGLPRQVKTDKEKGISYLDDFESTKSVQDYSSPFQWSLASFPTGTDMVRPSTSDERSANYTRAKLAWYRIDPSFYNSPKDYFSESKRQEYLSNHYMRQVTPREVFPNLTPTAGNNLLLDFIVHYMPAERGPYNYNADPAQIDPQTGKFINPDQNWAGLQRQTTGNTDFEATNVEFMEFWIMDPFKYNPSAISNGQLVLNLGKISEDVIPDGQRNFENGLPPDGSGSNTTVTPWGRAPSFIPPNNAFDNNPDARKFQDVGLDGIRDDEERSGDFHGSFVEAMNQLTGGNPEIMTRISNDPSSDNFKFFADYPQDTSITARYRDYNGFENNSPVPEGNGANGVPSNYQFPDNEDINRSNTLNLTEEYYEYKVRLNPNDLVVGRNYVVDKIQSEVKLANDKIDTISWYQFRVPLITGRAVNGIQNFKSIDYIRMYMTGFNEEVLLRFAKFQMVATQWRSFRGNVGDDGEVVISDPSNDPAFFEAATINIEENAGKSPVNYVIPPGIRRQNNPGDPTTNTLLNEQALVLKTCNLPDGEGRAVFKHVTFDFRSYSHLKMFVHAEAAPAPAVSNIVNTGDIRSFIRVGSDYTQNYYEYEIPLKPTMPGRYEPTSDEHPDRYAVWPAENEFDIILEDLTKLKSARNVELNSGKITLNDKYSIVNDKGHRVSIIGNPQLNNVKDIMVGIRNPKDGNGPICGEVWINELRVTDFHQQNGWAANARLNMKLADFANITLTGSRMTPGFGGIESKINDRNRFLITSYGTQGNFEMGKFTPKNWGIQIPVYLAYSESFKDYEYSPLDPDILFNEYLDAIPDKAFRDSIKQANQEYLRTRAYSFNNVRKSRMNPNRKTRLYQIENFAFTYGYNEQYQRSHLLQYQTNKTWNAGIDYNYAFRNKPVMPFKSKKEGAKTNLLREFNFNYLPKSVGVQVNGVRQFEERLFRATANSAPMAPNYTNNFIINRNYNMRWDLAKSLGLTYTAANVARVDEPYGPADTQAKRDSIKNNFFTYGKDPANGFYRTINFGRNISFNQNIALVYKMPFDKIKALNFISSQVSYNAGFRWETAQLQNQSLGNTIGNTRTISASPSVNLGSLYKKFPKLQKALDPKKAVSVRADTIKERFRAPKAIGKEILRVLLSMKTLDLNIQDNRSTTLPGYMPQTDNFGLDYGYTPPDSFGSGFPKSLPPGIPFILGSQKDIRKQAGNNGWISRDPAMANFYAQTKTQTITAKTGFVLIQDLKVDLIANRTTSLSQSSVYNYNPGLGQYVNSSENITGAHSISYIAISSHFGRVDSVSAYFDQFSDNRRVISKRLSNAEGGYNQEFQKFELAEGYYSGYDRSSQDVLIPAFLSAYGLSNVNLISTNPMPNIPLPNWSATYTGLSKLPGFKALFKSFTINHAYRCTYNVSNFTRNIVSQDSPKVQRLDPVTDVSGNMREMFNFRPVNQINTVAISEQFSPFIGVKVDWKNGITTGMDFNRDRNLAFNVGNKQLTEAKSKDLSFNFGWRKDKLNQSIKIFGKTINLKNALNAQCRVSVRNTQTRNRTLDFTGPSQVTNGNTTISVAPSVDYTVSKRLNIRAFVDHTINRPKVATSFPTSFTNFGIQLRFSLTG